MEAKELRIGNLVDLNNSDVVKIIGLDKLANEILPEKN